MKCFELRMLYSSCFGRSVSVSTGCGCDCEKRSSPRKPYLSRGIDDLRDVILALILDRLAEGVLDRGVVAVDEVTIDELHSER